MDEVERETQEAIKSVLAFVKGCRGMPDDELEMVVEMFVRYLVKKAKAGVFN